MVNSTRLTAQNHSGNTTGSTVSNIRFRFAGFLEDLRHWVDDEGTKTQEHERDPSASERFLRAVAQELEESLMEEIFAPPGLPLCVPKEFNIFFDPETDSHWVGNKRAALEQALNQALLAKVSELAGGSDIESAAPVVVLRVDGTLKRDQIRIKASWDQTRPGNTVVTPSRPESQYDPDATHVYLQGENPDGDATQIVISGVPLYHLEVWRASMRESVVPVTTDAITVGRGARTVPVNVRLHDPNVSRQHAIIEREDDGSIWVTHLGQNPTAVGARNINRGERVRIAPGESINICGFSLRIVED